MFTANLNLVNPNLLNSNLNLTTVEKQAYNLTPTHSSLKTVDRKSGKYYWEVTVTGIRTQFGWVPVSLNPLSAQQELSASPIYQKANSWCLVANTNGLASTTGYAPGQLISKNNLISFIPGLGPGTYGFAIDIGAGKLWISFNGVYVSGDPVTATLPSLSFGSAFDPGRPLVQVDNYDGSTGSIVGKFSTSTVANLPSGFTAWAEVGSLLDLWQDQYTPNVIAYFGFDGTATRSWLQDLTSTTKLTVTGTGLKQTANTPYSTGALEVNLANSNSATFVPPNVAINDFCVECIAAMPVVPSSGFTGLFGFGGIYTVVYNATGPAVQVMESAVQLISHTLTWGDTFRHVAIVRDGSTLTLYLDGVSVGFATTPTDPIPNATTIIGSDYANRYSTARIDEFRITINQPRYTGNFTPRLPLEPLQLPET